MNAENGCLVQLRNGDSWVRFTVLLTDPFTGGDLVRVVENANFSVEGADELSSAYDRINWVSGIGSGALYAFRTLKVQRLRIEVREFTGRLRASDMEAVAYGSALAVSRLANRELPGLRMEGWEADLRVYQPPRKEAERLQDVEGLAREAEDSRANRSSSDAVNAPESSGDTAPSAGP